MASTSKSVRFCEPEIKEYELVMFEVSWTGAQYHNPGLGEEEMAEFDADLLERQEQKKLPKRTHRLLALGRAAEMRASVLAYLEQGSATRLPDIVVPRRNERLAVPAPSNGPRSRRPAPHARVRNMPVASHNLELAAAARAAETTGDVDPTTGETAWQNEPTSEAACLNTTSFDAGGKSVKCDGDALVHAREVTQPRCASNSANFLRTAGRSHVPAWTSDDTKTVDIENGTWSDLGHQAHVTLQRHFGTATPEPESEISEQAALKGQPHVSPVPPVVRPRAPPPHRKFRRDGNSQSSSESIQDVDTVEEAPTSYANLPPRASSI